MRIALPHVLVVTNEWGSDFSENWLVDERNRRSLPYATPDNRLCFVSVHDFSRAVRAGKKVGALAPALFQYFRKDFTVAGAEVSA
jgi:hypothetical protein